jgi:sec-independent protein translocase protein TatC
MSERPDLQPESEQPLLTHLIEMRDRLLRAVLAVLVIFLGVFYFANDFYHIVATPLIEHLPDGASMISTKPAGTFFTPMKLALVMSIFAAMPFILYQMWAFVAPGLYTHERKLIIPLLVSSTLLFYAGMVFAYYVVFPLMFSFFVTVAPEGVTVMTDISEYLDFVLKIFFAFGIAFEVPIATILLVWIGVTTPESLAEKRPYIIVGAFIVGMLLTPPDIISQTLLALPMWLLFEVGLIASRYFLRMKREREEEEEVAESLDTEDDMDAALDRYESEEMNNRAAKDDDNNK